MSFKRSKSRSILAAGAGVAAVTFQGVFMSGCGSINPCLVKGPDGGWVDKCAYDASVDADDAAVDAKADAADAKTDAPSDAESDAASDAESDAPTDAPSE